MKLAAAVDCHAAYVTILYNIIILCVVGNTATRKNGPIELYINVCVTAIGGRRVCIVRYFIILSKRTGICNGFYICIIVSMFNK